MIIIGAKGFAIEIADLLLFNNPKEKLAFFDDQNVPSSLHILPGAELITNLPELYRRFANQDIQYTLGFGNPLRRFEMYNKLREHQGVLCSTISNKASISSTQTHIGAGCNILSGAIISNQVHIGIGSIVYFNCIITHGCQIGQFAEISPGAILLGNCSVGDFTHIGAGAKILPGIKIGKHAIIGAGAVVARDIPDYSVAIGVPAKVSRLNTI